MKIQIEILSRYVDEEDKLHAASGLKAVTYIVTINESKMTLTNKKDLISLLMMEFRKNV